MTHQQFNFSARKPQTDGSLAHQNWQQYLVAVTLGRPSASCKHLGVCKIEMLQKLPQSVLAANHNKGCPFVVAIASLSDTQGLEIIFCRSSIHPRTYHKHFMNTYFIVEEPYPFNMEGEVLFTIAKGQYPLLKSGTMITVRFDKRM